MMREPPSHRTSSSQLPKFSRRVHQQDKMFSSAVRRRNFVRSSSPPSPPPHDLEPGKAEMDLRRLPLRALLKRRFFELFLLLALVVFIGKGIRDYAVWSSRYNNVRSCTTTEFGASTSSKEPTLAFAPPENTTYRIPDSLDTFANYAWRNHSSCQISSLDLHAPFAPLCTTREDFLWAFSGGGRIGFNRPFIPLDCDMRWFSTEEICEIFGRFERVIVVGDSMMRHVVGALNVLLRRDLGYGAVTGWNFDETELRECFCNHQMDVKSCSLQGIYSTKSVLDHDPTSLACSPDLNIDLIIEMMLRFPLEAEEVARYTGLLSPTKPSKPHAFIFGHGLWNDLDIRATLNWLDGILAHTTQAAPYLAPSGHHSPLFPRLFIPPNAAGILKPDQWLISQGDKALMTFEESIRAEAGKRGVETMGTWNMSVQAGKYDGVHLDLKGNLIKAMGVVNWLNLIEVDQW